MSWTAPPAHPVATESAVHLWRGSLTACQESLARFRRRLNASECARADRFVTDDLGMRFTMGRSLLRSVLALYLDCRPREVEFEYGEQGKPFLAGETPLRFNLTHSSDIAVLAVTTGRELGVDIELRRASRDLDAIAQRYFSATEARALERYQGDERVSAFYRCWTRKEAYLKAKGGGLSAPLDRFVVTLSPEPRLVSTDLDEAGHQGWWFNAFDPGSNCTGALCVAGAECEVLAWEWDHLPD